MIFPAVELVAVNEGMLPVPLAANPMAVLEFVHVYVAPGGVLVKLVAATVLLLHTTILAGTVAVGVKLILSVVLLLAGHVPFVVNVIVYVLGVLALLSTLPVDVFRNTKPTGVAEKVPLAPPVMVADGSIPEFP